MNYEQKYLIYKQKYLNLKGGLFGSNPTAYSEYKGRETNISNKKVEEIKINDVDVKIDSFALQKEAGTRQYYGKIYHNYTIIILSLPNKVNTKNYVPYYKFEYTF